MNKKIVGILICLMLIALITPVLGDTDTIDVTLNPQATASITVDQSSWNPSAGLGDSESTAGDWATLTNNGLVQVDVTIKANDTNDWSLVTPTSIGHDSFSLQYTKLLLSGSEVKWEYYEGGTSSYALNTGKQRSFTIGDFGENKTIKATKVGYDGWYNSGTATLVYQLKDSTGTTILAESEQFSASSWGGPPHHFYEKTLTTNPVLESGETYILRLHVVSGTCSFGVMHGEGDNFRVYGFDAIGYENLTTSPVSFLENFSPIGGSNTYDFGLKIEMPTTSSTSQSQQTEITFEATAD